MTISTLTEYRQAEEELRLLKAGLEKAAEE